LPPEVVYERDRGISVWIDSQYDIGPSHYSFCRTRDFGAPVLRGVLLPRRDNLVIIQNTVNITNISYNESSNCIFNGGPDYVRVNRFAERPIPALKLVQNNNITIVNNTIVNNNVRIRNVNAVQQGNQLAVFNPRVTRPRREQMAERVRPRLAKTISAPRINNGWANLAPAERVAVRAKLKQEAKGLTRETARARPVRVADVEVVPQKADPRAKLPSTNPRARGARELAGPADASAGPAATVDPASPGSAGTTVVPARDSGVVREGRGRKRDANAPAEPGTTTPATAATSPAEPKTAPRNGRDAARATRENAADRTTSTAEPAPRVGETPGSPTTPDAGEAQRERVGRSGRGGLRKADVDNAPASAAERPAAAQAARETNQRRATAQEAAETRKQAAEEAAQRRAPEVQSARERGTEQAQQRQAAAENAREAAAARQRALQEQRAANRPDPVAPDQSAAQAARERAQEAAQERQRALQQQQGAARERAQEAAQQRQIQQAQRQGEQDQSAARLRAQEAMQQRQEAAQQRSQAVEQRQRLQQQQSQQNELQQRAFQQQEAAGARAQQAAEQRQRAAEQGQARQQAAQAQAAARQQAIERAQVQRAPREAPPARQAPGNGRRRQTPEEAAAGQRR
ncbi:MAG: Membrane protein involved in colicin uptake-like protein, partial [Chthoniobacter sp.]|nr:Membrane protein involved in colicin uptake-like protein [Chthoniobacter sp.]